MDFLFYFVNLILSVLQFLYILLINVRQPYCAHDSYRLNVDMSVRPSVCLSVILDIEVLKDRLVW